MWFWCGCLYAHALVIDANLALGGFAFLGRSSVIRGPRAASTAVDETRSARELSDRGDVGREVIAARTDSFGWSTTA